MRSLTVICYLLSLLSLGKGYSKMLAYKNVVIEHVNTYEYTLDLTLAISFLVLAIFFAVTGFTFYSLQLMEKQQSNSQKELTPRQTQSVYSHQPAPVYISAKG